MGKTSTTTTRTRTKQSLISTTTTSTTTAFLENTVTSTDAGFLSQLTTTREGSLMLFLGSFGISLFLVAAVGVLIYRHRKIEDPANFLPPMKKKKSSGPESRWKEAVLNPNGSKGGKAQPPPPLIDNTKKYYKKVDLLTDILVDPKHNTSSTENSPINQQAPKPNHESKRSISKGSIVNKELSKHWMTETVALKFFPSLNGKLKFESEMVVLKTLSPHQNIVTILGYCRDPRCIVMKHYETTLKDFLLASSSLPSSSSKKMTFEQKEDFGLQLALAMDHLHGCGLVHFDLKPSNVMMKQRNTLFLLVGNFGYAKPLGSNMQMRPVEETKLSPDYLAPELIGFCATRERFVLKDVHQRIDQFAFAITWLEILEEQRAWNGDRYQVFQACMEGKRPEISRNLEQQGPFGKPEYQYVFSLIRGCWNQDPEKRPAFEKIARIIAQIRSTRK